MDEIFYAKSKNANGYQETNKDHLAKVASLAGLYGEAIGSKDGAYTGGNLHDFGKNGQRFAGVLQGRYTNVDHAFSSAAALYAMVKTNPHPYRHIIEAVNGHHDGLVPLSGLQSAFDISLRQETPVVCQSGKTASLAGCKEYGLAVACFRRDFPDFKLPAFPELDENDNIPDMLHTRMIFSCMVDADYILSADPRYPIGKAEAVPQLDPEALLAKLESYRQQIKAVSQAEAALNKRRDMLYQRCGDMGRQPPGLYTLTAPTGTGKTLALLHFALRHMAAWQKRRIIVVLPFLTLAEQNSAVYSEIVPDILIDHSQSVLDDRTRELAANWDEPFIITTSVKFFEALFAQQPTDCRKLHHIANSVVIFDEAQSLPANLAAATTKSINSLCQRYGCTVVFSTATQPAFKALPETRWQPREILADHFDFYADPALKRTFVDWRMEQETPLREIADEMAGLASVCAIVNLRRHARLLYAALQILCPAEEIFFLTTDLCPAHRSAVLARLRDRQAQGLPCRLTATQCIEAGVDLDFWEMYRALAPLEAIIQAAGRCNRNGRLKQGIVHVFQPEDEDKPYPSEWYGNAAILVKILQERGGLDIHNPEHIAAYYTELLREAKEKPALTKGLKERDYQAVDQAYHLINRSGAQVIVPYAQCTQLYEEICWEAREKGLTPALMRKATPITVASFNHAAVASLCERVFYHRRGRNIAIPSDYYILSPGLQRYYADDIGLFFSRPEPEDFLA